MEKGDCFLMGAPGGCPKHLWIVISDPPKYEGFGVIVNLSTNEARSGGEFFLVKGEHSWLTEPRSWVCFKDAVLMTPSGWNDIETGINMRWIVPVDRLDASCVERIIAAAKVSRFFQPVLAKYLG